MVLIVGISNEMAELLRKLSLYQVQNHLLYIVQESERRGILWSPVVHALKKGYRCLLLVVFALLCRGSSCEE